MLVLIEGVDGSGKTTLVNQLHKLGYHTVNMNKFRGIEQQYFLYKDLNNLSELQTDNVMILDRSFISELVYRCIDLKQPDISLKDIASLLSACKIIFCTSNTAFDDSIARGETNIVDKNVSERLENLYNIFGTMISLFTNCKTYTYDWKHQRVDDVVKFIKET